MWNISFCCRVAKVTKDGLAPIELVITVDGQRSFKRLSMKVFPEEFKRSITCKRDNYIKQYCDSERVKVYEIFRKLEMLGMPITPAIVKEALDNKGITTSYRLPILPRAVFSFSFFVSLIITSENEFLNMFPI